MATKIILTNGNDKISGTANADNLDALAGNDTILGLGGNDTLIGNIGNDSLNGGNGNDNLQGSNGNDTLDGGTGFDILTGGAGDDVYFVDNVKDKIVEDNNSGGGVDTVNSSVTYSLADRNDKKGVEILILTGKQNLSATGNDGSNLLVGNSGNNILLGNGGNDNLQGGLGNDTLNGGTGANRLDGGAGSDVYLISSSLDSIIESANAPEQDADTVKSSISYTLPDNVEILTLTGSLDIDGTGNSTNNIINGNDGANQLFGAEGIDLINGNDGDDQLSGGAGNDTLDGGDGNDTAVYDGIEADYSVSFNNGDSTWTVIEDSSGDRDILSNMDTLQFADNSRELTSAIIPSLSVDDISVSEGNNGTKNAGFILTLSEATSQVVSVDYATLDDTAQAGSDYTSISGTISFAAGETHKTINIPIVGDKMVEANETLRLSLSNPNGIVLSGSEAVATLLNDDQPFLSIVGISLDEGNAGTKDATVTVNLSGAFDKPISVDYATADGTATAGSDYTKKTGSLTFNPGETSKTINVTVLGDSLAETHETLRVLLKNPTNAALDIKASTATITINDDDKPAAQPVLSIANVKAQEGNEGSTDATITVKLSVPATQEISVNYNTTDGTATVNSDYTAASGTLTFAVGETSKTFVVPVLGDTVAEANETVQLQLATPSNATLSPTAANAELTIIDDEPPLPKLSIASLSMPEGNSDSSMATLTVKLSTASTQDVTVSYATLDASAIAGNDYTGVSGNLTFAVGETSKTIEIGVLGDSILESDEKFSVILSAPINAVLDSAKTATVTLTNDDKGVVFNGWDTPITEDSDNVTTTTDNDRIDALAGDDFIDGNDGQDSISGGLGNDTLLGSAGHDTLVGGEGDDALSGADGIDWLLGDQGNDTLSGGTSGDILSGGDDEDSLAGDEGNDILSGDAGIDSLLGGTGNDTLTGGNGDDLLNGNADNDSLNGGNDNDTLYGEGGFDSIDGGAGNDSIDGGYRNDTLIGGTGNDTLIGGGDYWGDVYGTESGNDILIGGDGNDYLIDNNTYYGNGNDTLDGGAGNDILYAQEGNDLLTAGDGDDQLGYYISESNPNIVTLPTEEWGNDTLNGGAGNDTLNGGYDNDSLLGGAGDDVLYGNAKEPANDGADTLIGGAGNDTLTGNGGDDVFLFNLGDSGVGMGQRDIITDFYATSTTEVIDLTAVSPNKLALNGSSAFTGADQVRYVPDFVNKLTVIQINLNADLAPDMEIQLTGIIGLSLSDFVL